MSGIGSLAELFAAAGQSKLLDSIDASQTSLQDLVQALLSSRVELLDRLKQCGVASVGARQCIVNALSKARRAGSLRMHSDEGTRRVTSELAWARVQERLAKAAGNAITIRGKTDGFGAHLHAQMSGVVYALARGRPYTHSPMGPTMNEGIDRPATDAAALDAFGGMATFSVPEHTLSAPPEAHNIIQEVHYAEGPALEQFYSEDARELIRRKYHHPSTPPKPTLPAGVPVATAYAALHIRRGDVSEESTRHGAAQYRYGERFTPNASYVDLMPLLAAHHPGMPIVIFSQGAAEAFADLQAACPTSSPLSFCLDEPVDATFHALVCADVLIVARSSFSYAAALLSTGTVYSDVLQGWWHHPLPHWRSLHALPAIAPSKELATAKGAAAATAPASSALPATEQLQSQVGALLDVSAEGNRHNCANSSDAELRALLAEAKLADLHAQLAPSFSLDWYARCASDRTAFLAFLRDEVGIPRVLPRQSLANALSRRSRSGLVPLRLHYDAGFIIVHALDGLCNKLRVLLSFRQYALSQQRRLVVLWTVGDKCEGTFDELFEPIEDVVIIPWRAPEERGLDANPAARHAAATPSPSDQSKFLAPRGSQPEDERKLWAEIGDVIAAQQRGLPAVYEVHPCVKGTEAEWRAYGLLKPKPALQEAIDRNVREFGDDGDFVAAHIRRTDHTILFGVTKGSSDDDFARFFQRHANSKVYLATDNAATQQDLSAQLRFADGTSRMRALPSIGQQARLRHTSVEAAVVDIFTAAQARVFKGTYRSSFSDAILHLRRCTGRTHLDDEHSLSTEEGAKQQTYLHSLLPPERRYLGVFF